MKKQLVLGLVLMSGVNVLNALSDQDGYIGTFKKYPIKGYSQKSLRAVSEATIKLNEKAKKELNPSNKDYKTLLDLYKKSIAGARALPQQKAKKYCVNHCNTVLGNKAKYYGLTYNRSTKEYGCDCELLGSKFDKQKNK